MASGIHFPRNNLEQLRTIFGFGPNKTLMDVVFVSFDLEYFSSTHSDLRGKISQIGVSMLDTRYFSSENPASTLKTVHLVVGGHLKEISLWDIGTRWWEWDLCQWRDSQAFTHSRRTEQRSHYSPNYNSHRSWSSPRSPCPSMEGYHVWEDQHHYR